jgi:hypothetical protein
MTTDQVRTEEMRKALAAAYLAWLVRRFQQ